LIFRSIGQRSLLYSLGMYLYAGRVSSSGEGSEKVGSCS
jgi:hypothetical protein